MMDEKFAYVVTTGHRTGSPHKIEIWYVEHGGRHYIVAEHRERAHWVRNILMRPAVEYWIGRDGTPVQATARVIHPSAEPALARTVTGLMDAKYGWSDGLIVELSAGREG
jgi:deazaflavin-dependent oxidoreductase (nitroreductase family)